METNKQNESNESNEPVTDVIFRIDKGEVIAIFPAQCATNQYDVTIYVHNGQHGGGDPWVLRKYRLATETEYVDLKRELEQIGYQLRVVKRMTSTHKRMRRNEYEGVRRVSA